MIGFGKEQAEVYGIGSKYDSNIETIAKNERFLDQIAKETLPSTVKQEWVAGDAIAEDPVQLELKAKKIKRNKLKFSGISL